MELTNTFSFFKAHFPFLDESDIEEFIEITKQVKLQSDELFISKDSLNTKVGFVIKGLLRGYYVTENGVEKTVFFWREEAFVGSWEPTLIKQPSRLTIETIEPSILLVFDYARLLQLMEVNENIKKVYSHMIQYFLVDSLSHLQSFVNEKPEQRYKYFLKEKACLMKRVPQKYIASYLGITPVSLSRMKRRISDSELSLVNA